MQVILKFDLPDEGAEFRAALSGQAAISCLSHVANVLRNIRKYETHTEEELALAAMVEKELNDVVDANGIDLW